MPTPTLPANRVIDELKAPELPSQDQIQERFDAAAREGVSPCLWIPPEWDKLEKSKEGEPVFSNTCRDADWFKSMDAEEKIRRRRDEGARKDKKLVKLPEDLPDDDSWPHPFGDTSHIDETEFSSEDHASLAKRLSRDPELLDTLNDIVGSSSPGMRRLTGIFNWALYRTTILMDDLNKGLADESQYETARLNYIEFLRDLDDHEPEKGSKKSSRDVARQTAADKAESITEKSRTEIAEILRASIEQSLTAKFGPERAKKRATLLAREVGEQLEKKSLDEVEALSAPKLDMKNKLSASGYGRAIKWACIDPVIFGGEIVGTRVVAKWNPHVCSSGIPIPHG